MSKPTLLLAKWICPMDRPPIRDGGVAIIGDRIAAVDSGAALRLQFPTAPVIDYGNAALLPGLINAHTHLELTNRPRIPFDGDIVAWLLRQRPPAELLPEQHQSEVEAAMRAGIAQCLDFGVTCVGDISQQPQWTRPLLGKSPLRATSFGEVLGLGKLRGRTESMRRRAIDRSATTKNLRIGVSPHSPYTLEWPQLHTCVEDAQRHRLPLAIHLAEWRDEREFLLEEAGVFRQMWERLNLWDEQVQILHKRPVMLAVAARMLRQDTILAHVNYVSDEEIALLAAGSATVAFCPRTHAFFNHPPHRWRDMLTAGVNVAVGTDSCASSPNLNIVDDLRLLRSQDPAASSEILWSLITTRAAAAMNMTESIGSLSNGKFADIVVFPSRSDDPLSEILDDETGGCHDLWISGERVER